MNLFSMIGEFFKFLLNAPMAVVKGFQSWRKTRHSFERASQEVGREKGRWSRIKAMIKKAGIWAFILIGLLLVMLFYWGLYLANDSFNLERFLGGPIPWLRPVWLPLLFTLVMLSVILGWMLLKMLGPDKETGEFPDIDTAWDDIQAALVQAGIEVQETPLFLILGRPSAAIDDFFQAGKQNFLVRQAPIRPDAPIQGYANRQGIFVTAFGTSLLGKLGELIAAGKAPVDEPATTRAVRFVDEPITAPKPVAPVAAETQPVEGSTTNDPLLETPNLLAETGPVGFATEADLSPGRGPVRALPQLTKTDDIDLAKKRLTYLCRKLVKNRRPYCPLNGIVMLLPFEGLEDERDVSQLADLSEQDLMIVRDECQTRVPGYVAITGLEKAPGFRDFSARLEMERRQRLLGRDFPLWPDLRPDEIPGMLDQGLNAFYTSMAGLVETMFQAEQPGQTVRDVWPTNTSLYELVSSIRRRLRGTTRVLNRLVTGKGEGGIYLGGSFFTATGADPDLEQAFTPGVFRLLVEHQNKVAWTDDAIAEERDCQRWALLGYSAMGCFCMAMVVLAVMRWKGVG